MEKPAEEESGGRWSPADDSNFAVGLAPPSVPGGPDTYVLGHLIHSSSRTLLYRAIRKSDGEPVIVKTLPDGYRPADADHLRNEYVLGLRLDIPGVIRPLELWTWQARPALVLEHFEGGAMHLEASPPMPVGSFLDVACRLAAILAGIHGRKVVHKDIKPDNILYSARTGEVRITDFGLSSLWMTHRPAGEAAWTEGSLPYMSPEQTGRIDRMVDQRSDLYSLGITFYELLTGGYPFQAADPLEWAHCHIAKRPQSPREKVKEIPEPLAAVVLKLLAKDPEDRYQSARGLGMDLEECREQWERAGSIRPFAPGLKDSAEGLRIPRRLYGRERESAELKGALGRAAAGEGPELVLVSGYSGVGKSALVEALRRDSLAAEGMFVAGKFDQYHRDIPYATLVEAFSGAVLQILAAGTGGIALWKERLQSALGVNGRLMIEVIPLLEAVLDRQPPIPELPPGEARNRFRMVFSRFIGAFAREDRPLVLFLDDMQWTDGASLELVTDLVKERDLRHLLVVGAYRDNEVGAGHPLAIAVDSARKAGAGIRDLEVLPLSDGHLGSLLSDTLRPWSGDIHSLTSLVREKTGGNPFFAIQFLLALGEEGLVRQDGEGAWSWDLDAIRAKGYTENVVELMAGRLDRLSAPVREAMQRFACLGARSGPEDLARALGLDAEGCHERLSEAVAAGLVVAGADGYAFLHDRVQEAAYSSIPEADRPEWHLRIGRGLLSGRSRQEIEERVFGIVSQLNRGIGLIRDAADREELLELNLAAGRKAKASVAYATARACLAHAASLLPADAWDSRYRDCLSLHLDLAECEHLLGGFDRAEELIQLALGKARSLSDRAAIYGLSMRCRQLAGKFDRALDVSQECLGMYGMAWPEKDDDIAAGVAKAMGEIRESIRTRPIESLLDAPPASDPEVRCLISLLVGTIPTTFFVKPALFPWVVLQAVVQSLRHGNVEDSCIAYCCYGVIVDDVDEAYRFSEMSLRLNGKFGDVKRRSAVLYLHAAPHNYRKRPFATSFPMLEQGFVCGLETGDLLHASYCAIQHVTQAVESGMAFDHLAPLIDRYLGFMRQTRNVLVERSIAVHRQYVAALQGKTRSATRFDDEGFDEKAAMELFATTGFSPSTACVHIRKLALAVVHGLHDEALEHAAKAAAVLFAVRSVPLEAAYHYNLALALAGRLSAFPSDADPEARAEMEGRLAGEEAWLARLAGHCPENYGARHLLVAAETARLRGKDLEALRLYEKASESAEANGLLLDEGLIHEAAFRFNRDRGLERAAMHHLALARSAYRRLGAAGKVGLLDVHHPELRKEKRVGRDSSYESYAGQIDILSVAKASQAISGEILLDGLLRKVMAAMLEQAGAQWGCIQLRKGDRYAWAAEATLSDEGVVAVRLAPEGGSAEPPPRPLPQAILDFAARSKKRVILENASADASFSRDPYVARHKPKSVLCMPILRQGEPTGLLYLENGLLAGAFSPDKLEVLELMASQAAISLENARLYDGLRREYAERKQVEEQLRHSQKMDALGTLAAGIAHDFNNLLTAILGYSEMALVGMPAGDRLYQPMREVMKSGERAAGLTRQLLAYSRKQVLSPKLWSLNEIVRGMESMLQRLIGETVAMDVRLGAVEARVRADRGQVEQILMNLVVNARDAMPGGGQLTVETASVELDAAFCAAHPGMKPGAYVLLAVKDDGTGMEPEVRAKLFEPFFTTKGVGKGTGLGLAVVYGIVHQSGGGIAVDSEPGQGATFRIYLPRAGQGAEDAEPGPAPGKGPETRGGETILLVEDEESVRKFTSQALESQGYRVLSYARGRDALQAMELGFPEVHLAVSDIVMPDMGGKELAERLRKLRPGLPILFISGYADQPEGHDPLRGESLLQKPFGLYEILGRVRDILRTAA